MTLYEGLRLALEIAVVLASVGAWIFLFILKKDRASRAQVYKVHSRVDETNLRIDHLELKLVALEGTVGAMPEAREFHALANSVTETRGDVRAMRASMEGMEKMMVGLGDQITTFNKHLLDGGRRP